jgi:cyclase
MFRPRIIPVLLLKGSGLVKTVQFEKTTYIGDPINAVHIFNDMKADELVFLDISARSENRTLDFDLIKQIGDEAYMPFAVGGNIQTEEDVKKCMHAGAEKVVLNSAFFHQPDLLVRTADNYGRQSVIVSMDVKKNWRGKEFVYVNCGKLNTKIAPEAYAKMAEEKGAGEIMITSIDHDGTMKGYHLDLIRRVAESVNVPVIAAGGAGKLNDLKLAVTEGRASAAAAGSLFVYHGARKGVLINYPERKVLQNLFSS